jgi:uncharacterized protein YraI
VAPGPNDPQATALQPAYVRQGPGETYPAYGVAETGQTALVIGKSQDGAYWVVRLNPAVVGVGSGWVEVSMTTAKNVESAPVISAPPPPAPVVLPPPLQPGLPAATAITAVNLRTGPSTEYPVLAVAHIGVSQDGGWWQVRVQEAVSIDHMAWVSGAYVMAVNTVNVPVVNVPPPPTPIPAPPPPAAPSGNWVITIEPINVRAGPGNEYPSYGKIAIGTPLQVTGQSGNWLSVKVDFLPGGIGWISSSYVVPYTGPEAVLY